MSSFSFTLSDAEIARVAEWTSARAQPCGAIGGQFTFSFTPTGIGVVVKVRDCVTGEELDLTDYDSW